MANLLRNDLAFHAATLRSYVSEEITYSREGVGSVTLQATPSSKLLKLSDGEGGFVYERTDMDWIIPAADLVLNGEPTEPRRGDRITFEVGAYGEEQLFEVMPFGGGEEPPWRWSDPYQTIARVHTKRINAPGGGYY